MMAVYHLLVVDTVTLVSPHLLKHINFQCVI